MKSCVLGRTPGRDAHEHLLAAAARRGRRLQPLDLLERVDDEVADADVEAELDLGHRLVVAVEVDALGREAGGAGGGQLAAGGDVQREVLLGDQLAHRAAAERLAGVDDLVEVGARAEGRVVGAALVAQRLLVVDEQRRAELARQVHHVAAADLEVAGGVVDGGVRVDERVGHGGDPTIARVRSRARAGDRQILDAGARLHAGVVVVLERPHLGDQVGRRDRALRARGGRSSPARRRPACAASSASTSSTRDELEEQGRHELVEHDEVVVAALDQRPGRAKPGGGRGEVLFRGLALEHPVVEAALLARARRACVSVTISPQVGSDFMNCSTAGRRPWPRARRTSPSAAVVLPLPSPV